MMNIAIDIQWLMFAGLGVGLLGLAVVVFVISKNAQQTFKSNRNDGIHLSRQIKELLMNLQQHRGMVNVLLSGDKSFAPKITQKQSSIDQDLSKLDGHRNGGLLTAKRWDAIQSQWKELRAHAANMAAPDSFEGHSRLIREVLRSMSDVAERSQMRGNDAIDPIMVNALWNELPAAAECLGQARGIGASVAAKKYCSSVARIKLNFLEERIRETMTLVTEDIGRAEQSLAAAIKTDWKVACEAVESFLELLESSLLKVEHPTLDAEHYFSTATKALEAVFHAFDQATSAFSTR